MRYHRPAFAAAVLLAAAFAPVAGAQNLVTNPGFEQFGRNSGNVPGYTLTFNNGGIAAAQINRSATAHAGAGAFVFADPAPRSATLAQTLATQAGATYRVGFFALNAAAPNPDNRLTVTFGGVTLFDLVLLNGAYQEFSTTAVAAGPSTVLAFTGSNRPSVTRLDDLSVTRVDAAVVPEPATWALVGAGLLALGGTAARRRAVPGA